jgi:hypothetical protein
VAATKKNHTRKHNPNYKHGMGNQSNPTYSIWVAMRRRCRKSHGYVDRGISVCERWDKSFVSFLEDMGPKPDGLVIDRIDNDKGYSPDNCRWTTPKINSNNRRNTVMVTLDGITKSSSEWSEELGIKRHTISWRAKNGWSPERILGVTQ